jgi:hypothetical protein
LNLLRGFSSSLDAAFGPAADDGVPIEDDRDRDRVAAAAAWPAGGVFGKRPAARGARGDVSDVLSHAALDVQVSVFRSA